MRALTWRRGYWGGARASARFNVRREEAQEKAGPLAFRALKRRERRAPPCPMSSAGIGRGDEHLKKMGAVWQ